MNTYLSLKFKVLSFYLIILVVIIHAYNLNLLDTNLFTGYSLFIQNFITEGIARIAVPLFFLMSGYLFFVNIEISFKGFAFKFSRRVHSLLIPYLFWSLWSLIVFFTLQELPFSSTFFNNEPIRNFTAHEFFTILILHPLAHQLWFIRDLMLLVCLSPALYFGIKYLKIIFVVLLAVGWFYGLDLVLISIESCFFYVLGGYVSLVNPNWVEFRFNRKWVIFTGIWIAMVFIKTILLQIYGQSITTTMIHKLGVLTGIFAVWSLYDVVFEKKLPSHPLFINIISYAFFIYVFHEPVLTIIKKGLIFCIGRYELASLIIYLLTPIITILLALTTGYLFKRYFFKFYLFISGGR